MLTPKEEEFIKYWEANRLKKKKFLKQFAFGLPLSVLIVVAIMVSIISEWHKEAAAIIYSNSSVIITILVAIVAIVVFMTIFSSKYQWEQNEQRYQELVFKQQSNN